MPRARQRRGNWGGRSPLQEGRGGGMGNTGSRIPSQDGRGGGMGNTGGRIPPQGPFVTGRQHAVGGGGEPRQLLIHPQYAVGGGGEPRPLLIHPLPPIPPQQLVHAPLPFIPQLPILPYSGLIGPYNSNVFGVYPFNIDPSPHLQPMAYFPYLVENPYYTNQYPQTPVYYFNQTSPPEASSLETQIKKQIEYYFSDINLWKDISSLGKMDTEGWVSINEIAKFDWVGQLTAKFILLALQNSDFVEIQGEKIRKKSWSNLIEMPEKPRIISPGAESSRHHVAGTEGQNENHNVISTDLHTDLQVTGLNDIDEPVERKSKATTKINIFQEQENGCPIAFGAYRPPASEVRCSQSASIPGSSEPACFEQMSPPCSQHSNEFKEHGSNQEKYTEFHDFCPSGRERLARGDRGEIEKYYRSMSFSLRDEFVYSEYSNFYKMALEDSKANYDYGLECLFRFYSYHLEKQFDEVLCDDFEKLTLELYKKGKIYGLEKYWACHYYREFRGERPLKKHPELARLLKEYRSLEDFKAKKNAAYKGKKLQ